MDKTTTLVVTVEEIEELLSVIDYEYEFGKFNKEVWLQNPANFKDEEERRNYALWNGGRLAAMEQVTGKLTQTSIMKRLYSK